ncbi:hypothetical protein HX874_28075 [Pseudomonas gingeri]|nr:hypothetical protein [Pseudomonas gingeri]NWE32802.1 hypothetical protein [Pseudomonas gingeri]NWE60414.1 hypothetical protein [Pseudomonas gingeri]NWF05012.1 hypothetical protein [Pseudomonas gingeri]
MPAMTSSGWCSTAPSAAVSSCARSAAARSIGTSAPACSPWPAQPASRRAACCGGKCGGSSGGLVPLAVGTDTGGSIRIPSALCGTVGFKPGFNSVSVEGVFALSNMLSEWRSILNYSTKRYGRALSCRRRCAVGNTFVRCRYA